jgi:hypothetical protein
MNFKENFTDSDKPKDQGLIEIGSEDDEKWKQENWLNPENPEGVNRGLIKFNSQGLEVEYPGEIVITGRMEGGFLTFHKNAYQANRNSDCRFKGYVVESSNENEEVIIMSYSHDLPGGDSRIRAVINKVDHTIEFTRLPNVM